MRKRFLVLAAAALAAGPGFGADVFFPLTDFVGSVTGITNRTLRIVTLSMLPSISGTNLTLSDATSYTIPTNGQLTISNMAPRTFKAIYVGASKNTEWMFAVPDTNGTFNVLDLITTNTSESVVIATSMSWVNAALMAMSNRLDALKADRTNTQTYGNITNTGTYVAPVSTAARLTDPIATNLQAVGITNWGDFHQYDGHTRWYYMSEPAIPQNYVALEPLVNGFRLYDSDSDSYPWSYAAGASEFRGNISVIGSVTATGGFVGAILTNAALQGGSISDATGSFTTASIGSASVMGGSLSNVTMTKSTIQSSTASGTTRFLGGVANTPFELMSLTEGPNAAVAIETNSLVYVQSGPLAAFSIEGFDAGGVSNGFALELWNITDQPLTIANESGLDPTPANRISTLLGADITVTNNGVVKFRYYKDFSRWFLEPFSASGTSLSSSNVTITGLLTTPRIKGGTNTFTGGLQVTTLLPEGNFNSSTSNHFYIANLGDMYGIPALGVLPFWVVKETYEGWLGSNLKYNPASNRWERAVAGYNSGYLEIPGQEGFWFHGGDSDIEYYDNNQPGGMMALLFRGSKVPSGPTNGMWGLWCVPQMICMDPSAPASWKGSNDHPGLWIQMRGYSPTTNLSYTEGIRLEETDTNGVGGITRFRKQRGSWMHVPEPVQSQDVIHHLLFEGYNPTGVYAPVVDLRAGVDAAPGGGTNMPGIFVIAVTQVGSTNPTEVVRVNSQNRVGIGNELFPSNTVSLKGNLAVGSASYTERAAPANGAIIEGFTGIGTYSPSNNVPLTVAGNSGLSMVLNAAVGIGMLPVAADLLSINYNSASQNALQIVNTNAGGRTWIQGDDAGGAAAGSYGFYANGFTPLMMNGGTGEATVEKLGIGTNAAAAQLHVRYNGASIQAFKLQNTEASGRTWSISDHIGAAAAGQLGIYSASGYTVLVLDGGLDQTATFGGIARAPGLQMTNSVFQWALLQNGDLSLGQSNRSASITLTSSDGNIAATSLAVGSVTNTGSFSGAYRASDGTAGVSTNFSTTNTITWTVKNGIITAVSY